MPRLLHLADVHLGARHPELGQAAPRQRERQAAAFRRAIDVGLEAQVDVALVCGDLFDSNAQPRRIVEAAALELRRLTERSVRVVIIPGTHDAWEGGSIYRVFDLRLMAGLSEGSDLLTVLTPQHPDVVLKDLDLVVYGRVTPTRRVSRSPLADFDVRRDTRASWRVAMVHGSFMTASGEHDDTDDESCSRLRRWPRPASTISPSVTPMCGRRAPPGARPGRHRDRSNPWGRSRKTLGGSPSWSSRIALAAGRSRSARRSSAGRAIPAARYSSFGGPLASRPRVTSPEPGGPERRARRHASRRRRSLAGRGPGGRVAGARGGLPRGPGPGRIESGPRRQRPSGTGHVRFHVRGAPHPTARHAGTERGRPGHRGCTVSARPRSAAPRRPPTGG